MIIAGRLFTFNKFALVSSEYRMNGYIAMVLNDLDIFPSKIRFLLSIWHFFNNGFGVNIMWWKILPWEIFKTTVQRKGENTQQVFFFIKICDLIFFFKSFQVIKAGVKTTCKCHGVSGSCTVRTCWRQLSPFHEIGKQLKQKYETSLKVGSTTNEATGEGDISPPKKAVSGHSDQIPRTTDLIYIDDSPSFCRMSRFSPGTAGRRCYKDKNCESICCGRGHNTQSKVVTRPCQCQVRWCCYVECKQCTQREEVYTCKD